MLGVRDWKLVFAAWRLTDLGISGILVGVFSLLGVVIWLVYLVVSEMVRWRFRLAEQNGLMWTLAIASEKHLPLAPAIEAYAWECSGGYERRLRRMVAAIEGGTDVASALESYARLPSEFTLAAQVGQMTGQLGPALRENLRNRLSFAPLRDAVVRRLLYFFLVFVALQGFGAFYFIKILPAFKKICEDFGIDITQTSPAMQWVMETVTPVMGPLVALQVLALVYVLVAPFFRSPLPFRSRRLDTIAILRALSFFTRRNLSLAAAFRTLAMCYPWRRARRRLEGVCSDVENGADWVASLRSHRLLREAEVVVIEAAQRVGNLPWALSEMADSVQRRHLYRWRAALEFISPWLVLAIGAVVMYVVVSCFYPLVFIIETMEKS